MDRELSWKQRETRFLIMLQILFILYITSPQRIRSGIASLDSGYFLGTGMIPYTQCIPYLPTLTPQTTPTARHIYHTWSIWA